MRYRYMEPMVSADTSKFGSRIEIVHASDYPSSLQLQVQECMRLFIQNDEICGPITTDLCGINFILVCHAL